MLFSIVVPIFNIQEYLRECVESILSQTFLDYELILVDDGSTDESSKICDEYAKRESRVVVIHKENGGLISARIEGVKVARGQYVVAVDGDDFVHCEMLNELSKCINENSSPDIICFDHNIYCEKFTKPVASRFQEGHYNRQQIINIFYPCLIKAADGACFPPTIWAKAFKRELYLKFQTQLNPKIKLAEDACVVRPCVYHAQSIYFLKKAFYYYRYNPSSMTKSRAKGFPWQDVELRLQWVQEVLPVDDSLFYEQVCRDVTHSLFNIAKSWLQTNESYREIRKEIKKQFSSQELQPYIKGCRFKNNIKESIASFMVRHKCVVGIKIIAMYEQMSKRK